MSNAECAEKGKSRSYEREVEHDKDRGENMNKEARKRMWKRRYHVVIIVSGYSLVI